MNNNVCEKCGNELFLKNVLENSYEYCCLSCFNLSPLDRTKSLELCREYIELTKQASLNYCQRFSREMLLYLALNTREMILKEFPDVINIKVGDILWPTLIIRDCLDKSFNGQGNYSKENLDHLFSYYSERIIAENLLIEIQENYFYLFEDSHELKELVPNSLIIVLNNDRRYRAVPSYRWRYFIEAAETVHFGPSIRKERIIKLINMRVRERQLKKKRIDIQLNRANKRKRKQLIRKRSELDEISIAETLEELYNSIYLRYYNEDFLAFSEIRKEEKILSFIGQIIAVGRERLNHAEQDQKYKKYYYEMSYDEFIHFCSLNSLDFAEMCDMLLSCEMDCKQFPLLIEYGSKILVCPETITLILSLIRFDFAKCEYKSKLGSLGDDFEEKTIELFESEGFSLDHPKNKEQKLVKIKISCINREIDLLPYNDKYLFVVECKRNSLKPKYIFDYERKNRALGNEGIKDEIENKHLMRVRYFQNNQEEFGFSSIKTVKGLIVTLIKEDIENYNGVDVVPFSDLQEYIKNYIT
jgi:hypothetical protein